MSWPCKIGLHDWIPCGHEEVTYPKRGPFDPRSESGRTYNREMEICSQCGKKQERDIDYEGI